MKIFPYSLAYYFPAVHQKLCFIGASIEAHFGLFKNSILFVWTRCPVDCFGDSWICPGSPSVVDIPSSRKLVPPENCCRHLLDNTPENIPLLKSFLAGTLWGRTPEICVSCGSNLCHTNIYRMCYKFINSATFRSSDYCSYVNFWSLHGIHSCAPKCGSIWWFAFQVGSCGPVTVRSVNWRIVDTTTVQERKGVDFFLWLLEFIPYHYNDSPESYKCWISRPDSAETYR